MEHKTSTAACAKYVAGFALFVGLYEIAGWLWVAEESASGSSGSNASMPSNVSGGCAHAEPAMQIVMLLAPLFRNVLYFMLAAPWMHDLMRRTVLPYALTQPDCGIVDIPRNNFQPKKAEVRERRASLAGARCYLLKLFSQAAPPRRLSGSGHH